MHDTSKNSYWPPRSLLHGKWYTLVVFKVPFGGKKKFYIFINCRPILMHEASKNSYWPPGHYYMENGTPRRCLRCLLAGKNKNFISSLIVDRFWCMMHKKNSYWPHGHYYLENGTPRRCLRCLLAEKIKNFISSLIVDRFWCMGKWYTSKMFKVPFCGKK